MIQRLLFSENSPNLGGQELQLLQQMAALRERGIAVRLLCRHASRIGQLARERGLESVAIPFRNSLHLPSILAVARVVRDWRPDAVISHSGHDANNCAIAARLVRNRPRLIRVRTYQPGLPHAWTYNLLADLTLVPSEAIRRSLLANPHIRPERIRVLYPGLIFERLDHQAQAPLPPRIAAWLASHPGPLIVHAAMLRGEKGHGLMLEAMARLVKIFPGLRYVVAGEGELRQSLESSVREMGLSEHVLIAGLLASVPPLLRRADLVVMPSSYEPLGMSQIEALALGVPVVASRTGGIPETIEDRRSGLLVTAGDVSQWTSALSWALEHLPEMRSMAETGGNFVKSRFSMTANIDQLLACLDSRNALPKA